MARKFIALTSGEHSFRTVTISLKDVLYPKTSLSLFSGSPDALSLQRQTPLSKTENLFSKDRDSLTKNTRAYVLPWEVYHGPFVQSVPSFSHLVQFCQSQFLYWRNATGLSLHHLRHCLRAGHQTRGMTPPAMLTFCDRQRLASPPTLSPCCMRAFLQLGRAARPASVPLSVSFLLRGGIGQFPFCHCNMPGVRASFR